MRTIIIRTNGKYEVAEIDKGTAALDEIVEGESGCMTFTDRMDMVMFLNERSRYEEMPVNCRASMLYIEYENTIGLLEGNAVLCGLDEEGYTCDLTDEQIEEVIHIISGAAYR